MSTALTEQTTAETTQTTATTGETTATETAKTAESTATSEATATEQTTGQQTTSETAQSGQTPQPPEKYELTVPKDSLLGDDDLAFAATEAKALGLTNEQAQSLVNARAAALSEAAGRFLADAKADPEIGGAKFDDTVKHAQAGVAWLFKDADELAQIQGWFNKTGLGNHKTFLRAMARIGKARAEDTGVGSGSAATGGVSTKSTADLLYGSAT